jgi:AraC-like DNA-binding protein
MNARGPTSRSGSGSVTGSSHVRRSTSDRDEAQDIVTRFYLPNRLHLTRFPDPLEMELSGLQLGSLTAGRLSYGRALRLQTADAQNFHFNMPLRGGAVSRRGGGPGVATSVGQALVFSPGAPADITWSARCVQLCLMVPRARLEVELERLLGHSVGTPLAFDFDVALPGHAARRWRAVLDLVVDELDHPSGMTRQAVAGQHIEGLVLDGLLLAQPHNYWDATHRPAVRRPGPAIKRAIELIEERPEEPWTTVGLAAEVHLSVRALQEGFKRDLDMSPLAYLRLVRLRRVHHVLKRASPESTTVGAVAVSFGLLHLGRFAANYRAAFGEMPSETLRRRTT